MAKGIPGLRSNSSRIVLGLLLGIAALELGISGKLGAIVTLAYNPNGAWLYGWDPVTYYNPVTSGKPQSSTTSTPPTPTVQTL